MKKLSLLLAHRYHLRNDPTVPRKVKTIKDWLHQRGFRWISTKILNSGFTIVVSIKAEIPDYGPVEIETTYQQTSKAETYSWTEYGVFFEEEDSTSGMGAWTLDEAWDRTKRLMEKHQKWLKRVVQAVDLSTRELTPEEKGYWTQALAKISALFSKEDPLLGDMTQYLSYTFGTPGKINSLLDLWRLQHTLTDKKRSLKHWLSVPGEVTTHRRVVYRFLSFYIDKLALLWKVSMSPIVKEFRQLMEQHHLKITKDQLSKDKYWATVDLSQDHRARLLLYPAAHSFQEGMGDWGAQINLDKRDQQGTFQLQRQFAFSSRTFPKLSLMWEKVMRFHGWSAKSPQAQTAIKQRQQDRMLAFFRSKGFSDVTPVSPASQLETAVAVLLMVPDIGTVEASAHTDGAEWVYYDMSTAARRYLRVEADSLEGVYHKFMAAWQEPEVPY